MKLFTGVPLATGLFALALAGGGTAAVTLVATHGSPAPAPGSIVSVESMGSSSTDEQSESTESTDRDTDTHDSSESAEDTSSTTKETSKTSKEDRGSVVTSAVSSCKAAEEKADASEEKAEASAPTTARDKDEHGHEGIGQCVSAVARHHGSTSTSTSSATS